MPITGVPWAGVPRAGVPFAGVIPGEIFCDISGLIVMPPDGEGVCKAVLRAGTLSLLISISSSSDRLYSELEF